MSCISIKSLHIIFYKNEVMVFFSTGAFPFSVGCFAVYVNVDRLWQEPPPRFTPLQNFINGCIAAGVAQTLSYPFETVKRKMQVIFSLKHVGNKVSLLLFVK